MRDDLRKAIEDHAKTDYPRESCGLLVYVMGVYRYFPCRNLSGNTDHFILDPRDYARAEQTGTITAIVHSHPDTSPQPSQADRVACEASGLPWHIIAVPKGTWGYLQPSGYEAPLKGRLWCHWVLDCYTLIRDWYRQERGVILPDFDRATDWWHKGENLYVENFSKAGFYRITDALPEPGDVLLMQILANVPNHGAVYLGENKILHHLHGRLSCEDIWGGYYRKHTTHILRFGDEKKNHPLG